MATKSITKIKIRIMKIRGKQAEFDNRPLFEAELLRAVHNKTRWFAVSYNPGHPHIYIYGKSCQTL